LVDEKCKDSIIMESKDTTNAAHAPLLTTTRKLFISGAWRKTISLGILAGSVVLTINVIVLGWISARHAFSITGATVFTGIAKFETG